MATSRASSDDLRRYGEQLRGSFVPGNAHSQDHQPPADHVSHETHQPIRLITRIESTHVGVLPDGSMGLGFKVVDEIHAFGEGETKSAVEFAPEHFTITAYADTHQSPSREQEPPRSKPLPAAPTRPEHDQRRTDRPTQPRQGEQVKPAPNRQVRPK